MSTAAPQPATELALTIPAPSRMSFPQVQMQLFAIEFVFDLAEVMLLADLTDELQRGDAVRISRLQYGSPLQIVIDLTEISDLLKSVGSVGFSVIAYKLLTKGPEAWKTLEEALALRAERKAARRAARLEKSESETSKEPAAPDAHGDELLEGSIAAFLAPVADDVMTVSEQNGLGLDRNQVLAAGIKYIEIHEYESRSAGQMLKKTTVKVEFK